MPTNEELSPEQQQRKHYKAPTTRRLIRDVSPLEQRMMTLDKIKVKSERDDRPNSIDHSDAAGSPNTKRFATDNDYASGLPQKRSV